MAKYKNGILGPASGRIGNVVASSYKGIDYMRSMPVPSSKAPTPAQTRQRRLFSAVNGWLKPIRDVIDVGFQVIGGSKTPMNLAVSHMMTDGVTDAAIDFSKAVFSKGVLFISIVREVLALADAILYIQWDDALPSAFCKSDDLATFIIYNPAKEQFVTFPDVAERAEQEVMLQLPAGFKDDEVHCWMQYVNAKGDGVSTSAYLGEFLV